MTYSPERRARCAYYGKPVRKSECNYHGDVDGICRCEQPSSAPLPFFKPLGVGSPDSLNLCKCGFAKSAHDPYWCATIHIDRKWYAHEHYISDYAFSVFAPDEEAARAQGEEKAQSFRNMVGKYHTDTEVYSAVVTSVRPQRQTHVKCRTFTAKGPAEFDEFYCGCHSWD